MIKTFNGISIGDHVKEKMKPYHEGIVVKIRPGTDNENHGTIYVWQLNRTEYGADNCEHYSAVNWQNSLKIIK